MEDVEADDAIGSGSNSRGPIREASSATNKKDKNLIYDRTHFRRDKVRCHYNLYYSERRVIIEQ